MPRYTAQISRNFRDIATGAPKALLRNVIQEDDEEFRDHIWVELSAELREFFKRELPKNGKRIISFRAKEKVYKYRGELVKRTLKNVKNITVLGRG